MYIPDAVKKSVVFIYDKNKKPRGTGFFVSVPLSSDPSRAFIHLVTARHNIASAKSIDHDYFFVRINTLDGESIYYKIDLSGGWTYHPNHAFEPADVAVGIVSLDSRLHDCMAIPISMLLTPELMKQGKIDVGNEVFITGLFTGLHGQKRNIPIVRFGNIAMMPDEKIKTKMGDIEAYLIECRSIGGISGSPVFFCKSIFRQMRIGVPLLFI